MCSPMPLPARVWDAYVKNVAGTAEPPQREFVWESTAKHFSDHVDPDVPLDQRGFGT